jgi:LiaI-LiaF-like transmembrane region
MNCAFHADVENTAFCIRCGKPLCAQCVRQVQSSIYCENCLMEISSAPGGEGGTAAGAATTSQSSPAMHYAGGTSPEAGFFLGLIPGVGAIYNAEYFKAALHLLIFGTLVTLVDTAGRSAGPLFGLLAFGFYAYMPFEAYYTAKKRKLARDGINLITPFDQLNEQMGQFGGMELWGGIGLVLAGTLFLLDNFEILSLEKVGRFWPALLILAGVAFISRFLKGNKA